MQEYDQEYSNDSISDLGAAYKSAASAPGRMSRPQTIIGSALFTFCFFIAVLVTGFGSALILSNNESLASSALPVLWGNFILISLLALYLAIRIWSVLFSARAGETAPQLHRRFVVIFSLAAILPAIIVGVFFGLLVSRDVNEWYDDNIGIVLDDANEITTSYVRGEVLKIRPDIYAMSQDLNRQSDLISDRITYNAYLIQQAVFREVPILYIVNSEGTILAKAEQPSAPAYRPPTELMYNNASSGALTMDLWEAADILVVLNKLENYQDAYLYTGKYMEPDIIASMNRISRVENSLGRLTTGQGQINNIFLLTYAQAAILLLMAAIWLGLILANRIVKPLGQMVQAAEKVRSGDLSTRVNVSGVWDEMSDLASAFNRMTSQLGSQREDLIREHDISEQRRQFSEAVLSGVSAGVIGLSPKGRITLINSSAEILLNLKASDVLNQPIDQVIVTFAPAYLAAKETVQGVYEDQVEFDGRDGGRNFDLRVSAYRGDREDTGWVMTFDDMTRIVAAQRQSAWRDVARRIAHEIKNPLTPIQLSAERLERKYGKEINSDPETFTHLTQTILRQVDSLGNMVDEFSTFARMPTPIIERNNFRAILESAVFEQRVAFPEIAFKISEVSADYSNILCDERMMGQALMNLLKNSGESITTRLDKEGTGHGGGEVNISLTQEEQDGMGLRLVISDNGAGWPIPDKDRLLEPYVTTRDKGTGLGLPIVKRIIEDHGGTLELSDQDEGLSGARVTIRLPVSNVNSLVANDRNQNAALSNLAK